MPGARKRTTRRAGLSLLVMLACCGPAPAAKTVTLPRAVSAPAPRVTEKPTGALIWWTKVDVTGEFPAFTLLPRRDGGVTLYATLLGATTQGMTASGAREVSLDPAGRAYVEPLAFDGTKASSMARDRMGNVIVAANFFGHARIGDAELKAGYGLGLVKLDPRGHALWHLTFQQLSFGSLAATPDGGVVLAGTIATPTDLGGGVVGDPSWSGAAFLAAFDAQGRHVFSRAFDVGDVYPNERVAVDDAGRITLVAPGSAQANPDFGGGAMRGPQPRTFIARFDAHGAHLRSTSVRVAFRAASVGRGGDVVLSGTMPGARAFERERVVVRDDRAGRETWRRSFGRQEAPTDVIPVALDDGGDALVAAWQWPKDGHAFTDVVSFDPDGKQVFARRIQGTAFVHDAVYAPDGAAFLAGIGLSDLGYGRRSLALGRQGTFVMKIR